jgi:hypothetical protein
MERERGNGKVSFVLKRRTARGLPLEVAGRVRASACPSTAHASGVASLALRWAYRVSTGNDPGHRFAFRA